MNNITSKKLAKIGLLVVALLPYIDWILGMIIVGDDGPTKAPFFITLTLLYIVSIPIQWILYIGNVFRNKTVSKETRWLWVLVLFGGTNLVFPVYWYLHIWRDKDEIPSPLDKPMPKTSCFNSKKSRIILLLSSLLPFVFLLTTLVSRLFLASDTLFYIFGALFYLSIFILAVVYVIDVYRNVSVASDQRLLWAILMVAMNMLIFPVYWYLHIRQKQAYRLDTTPPV